MKIYSLNKNFEICDKDENLQSKLCILLQKSNKINPKILDSKDKEKIKFHKNLIHNLDFIASKTLSFKTRDFKNIYKYHAKSHSNAIATILYANQKVGIDIECIKKRDFRAHLELCFDSFERKKILNSKNSLLEFYKFWTLKESTLKLFEVNLGFIKEVSITKNGVFFAKQKIYFKHINTNIYNKKVLITITYLKSND